jgi:RecA-family ATPase
MRFLPLSQMSVPCLQWLWLHRLALGELALLEGDPEMGKSLVTLDLAARVTTGRSFPDGSPGQAAANVLLLNAEDSPAVLKPRLEHLGADLDRVFFFQTDDDDPGPGPAFPRDLDLLDHELARTRARLVIMDPVADFLDRTICSHSDQSVRRALHPLARLTAQHQAVGLLVHHLNKNGGKRALYRGHGSIAFAGVCRSAWLIAPDPGDLSAHEERRRVLAQVKNNYAPPQPSLAFSVTSQPPGAARVD